MLVICMGAAVYLGVKGVQELRDRKAGVDYYEQLGAQVSAATDSANAATHAPAADATFDPAADETLLPAETAEPEVLPEEITELPPLQVDFRALRKTCPDAVGWIRIGGTLIDYPVVQGKDNDFYLSHLPNGAANSGGSIMMDFGCVPNFSSDVTILHGHHMKNGAMFGDLDEYKDPEYFAAHPVIELCTPDGLYEAQIFAAYTVNARSFGYETRFSSEKAFNSYVQKAKAATPFDAGVDVEYGDRLLLLSTCNYSFKDARFIVIGKIVPVEELDPMTEK